MRNNKNLNEGIMKALKNPQARRELASNAAVGVLGTTVVLGSALAGAAHSARAKYSYNLSSALEDQQRASLATTAAYHNLQKTAAGQQRPSLAPGMDKQFRAKPRRRLEETLKDHYKQRLQEQLELNEISVMGSARQGFRRGAQAAKSSLPRSAGNIRHDLAHFGGGIVGAIGGAARAIGQNIRQAGNRLPTAANRAEYIAHQAGRAAGAARFITNVRTQGIQPGGREEDFAMRTSSRLYNILGHSDERFAGAAIDGVDDGAYGRALDPRYGGGK